MSSHSQHHPLRTYKLLVILLLAVYLAQCIWFVAQVPLTSSESQRVITGFEFIHHSPQARQAMSRGVTSPMIPLLAVAGFLFHPSPLPPSSDLSAMDEHRWFIRAPFMAAGLFLAFSLCYVARRLYGRSAGLIALTLYIFSPTVIARSSQAGPEIFAAWGAFGLIFASIATAHTLYAPREVILWNWKRILLLAVAISIATGASWPLSWMLLPSAAFMLWAVPHRRGAALLILASALLIALFMLDAFYLADTGTLLRAIFNTGTQTWSVRSSGLTAFCRNFFFHPGSGALAGFLITFPVWCLWPRTRFFSNTAPLIVFLFLLFSAFCFPQHGIGIMIFASLPFLFIFTAGVFADLLESRFRFYTIIVIFFLFAGKAIYCIHGLIHLHA